MSSEAPPRGAPPAHPRRSARTVPPGGRPASGAGGRGAAAAAAEAGGERAHPALRLLNVGYANFVLVSRVVAVVSPQSAPMKRLREEAAGRGKLVDATQGRRTRSILVTDSDHVILSALNPETIAARMGAGTAPDGGP